MIIDISKLPTQATPTHELPHTTTQNQSDGIHQTTTDESGQPQPQPQPMEVRSPNILKVVMLASETITSETGGARPMDLLSLSGVVIKNERGVWSLVEGANFHDPLPSDCADHTENFVLPGGIRAIFNHSRTPKRWHVLPPPTPSHSTPNFCPSAPLPPASLSFHSSIPLNSPQYYRKVIVTEIGAAFHDIVSHFEKTRAIEEKKRIGIYMHIQYIYNDSTCECKAYTIYMYIYNDSTCECKAYTIYMYIYNDSTCECKAYTIYMYIYNDSTCECTIYMYIYNDSTCECKAYTVEPLKSGHHWAGFMNSVICGR